MLDKIDKKKNPFKVPENYFQDFNADIMNKLPIKEVKKAKVLPLWKKVLPWTAVAAAFCGILFSLGIFNEKPITDTNSILSSGLTYSMEDDYYMFLEDEVIEAQYKDVFFNN